jgi:hypothetical protein
MAFGVKEVAPGKFLFKNAFVSERLEQSIRRYQTKMCVLLNKCVLERANWQQ